MTNPIQNAGEAPAAPKSAVSASRRRRFRRGGAVLEGALVLPLLILITMPMIEFAQMFFVKHTFASASRDGARKAILGTVTHTEARTAVENTMTAAGFSTNKYTLVFYNAANTPNTVISDVGAITSGIPIKVTITADYGKVGYPQWFIRGNRVVTGSSTMIKE